MNIDHAKVRRENVRWYILLALYNASPAGAYEELVISTVQAIYGDATLLEVRRELDYLFERELVSVERRPDGRWWADINRHGTDLVEYTVDCDPGIARPSKYFAGR